MRSRLLSHLFVTFRHHTSLMLVTVLVLTGSFFVSGGLILTGQNLQKVLTLWGESLQMSVYIKEDATPEQTESLRRRVANDRRVGKSDWVTREQALSTFQEQMASYAPDLLKDASLVRFIPESLQIQLSEAIGAGQQADTLQRLTEDLRAEPAVEEVSYGQEWVSAYTAVVKTFSRTGTWLVLLLASASLFVISNSVSSSIQQRRNEIEVLELVGASKWFIRGPYLVEGLLIGFVSAALALILLALGFWALKEQFQSQIAFLRLSHQLQFFSALWVTLFCLSGLLIGLLSAALSLRKLNDGWAASQAGQEH